MLMLGAEAPRLLRWLHGVKETDLKESHPTFDLGIVDCKLYIL